MDVSGFTKNVSYAFVAQVISLFASLVTSLVVPKVLDSEQFGFWQLFIFYSSYVGFFHFGLNDGVYLIKGGKTRDEIEHDEIKAQFFCGLVLETLIALVISLFAIAFCDEGNRVFVLCATAVYLVLKNSSDYFGYVFQATNETRLYSVFSIIDRICFLALLLVLICFNSPAFQPYVISYLFARTIGMIYSLIKAREYLNAPAIGVQKAIILAIDSIKVGIKLLLANLTSMLILGFGRFLVDEVWGIVTFGQLSLALSLVNFVLVFATQFAMVLFPALRQLKRRERLFVFTSIKDFLYIATPMLYLLYFPVFLLVRWWLPSYSDMAAYLGLLLPICVFDVKMNLLGATFLKVLRREGLLLVCNAICLALSMCLSIIGVYSLGDIVFVVIGMVICIVLRSVLADGMLSYLMDLPLFTIKQAVEICLTAAFMLAVTLMPLKQAFLIVLAFCLIYLLLSRKTLNRVFEIVSNQLLRKETSK
ncbi:oligosaccharide flippase family protein [Collinsella tanakaei]|nr:oligosaccharide flippase family protein [Collinsella tanakaei]